MITELLQFHAQLKLWHWQTLSFAQHNAFGDAYEAIEDPMDELVEASIGITGREKITALDLTINGDLATVNAKILEFKVFLVGLNREFAAYTDILNLRDSILGEVDQLLYRLTLS